MLQDLRAVECWPLWSRLTITGMAFGAAFCLQIPLERDWPGEPFLLFLLVVIAATLCFAGAAIFGRGFGTLDPLVPATGSMLCGSMVLVPISFVAEKPWTIAPSATSVAALMALSVFSTAFAFALYFRLVRTLGSVGVTAQAYLRVPVGVAIGVEISGYHGSG